MVQLEFNMKNHWLDKKIDKEIDKAFEEFKDTDFIDLSCVTQYNDRYKEYDRLELQEKFIEENVKALDPFDFGDEEHDRAVVTEILLKYMNKPHWIKEVLSDVGYYGYATQDTLGNLTIDTTDAVMTSWNDSNFTIMLGDKWPECTNTNTVSGDIPGGDGIKLGEVKTSEFGQICSKCNEEMWPMNTATTMCQGDPACACYRNSCNLSGYQISQNETLQVIDDRIKGRDITQFQTMYTPVIPGTMIGTVYPTPGNRSYGFVFFVSSEGKFEFTRFVAGADGKPEFAKHEDLSDGECLQKMAAGLFDDRFMGWYDEVYACETSLNCQTGVLELHYHMGHTPEVIISYEYQNECHEYQKECQL